MILLLNIAVILLAICTISLSWDSKEHRKRIESLEKQLEMQRWEIDVQNVKLTAIQDRLIAGR